ncbi:MAG: hypothetical protein AAF458_00210 [Pseudomonadota bacterium]
MRHLAAGSRPIVLVAAIVLTIPALSIAAGKKGQRADALFERYDTNQDQVVTASEVNAERSKTLATHDANGDGALTMAEFEQVWLERMRPRLERAFQRLDTDGDARVSSGEYQQTTDRLMSRLDTNGDQQITRDELLAAREARKGRRGKARRQEIQSN